MPVSSVTEHWIKPDAVTINLNHFGDPDYLQVSVLAGAVVMAFKQDVIAYNAAHNYRTWPLQAANTYLETTSAYNVYARLTRSEMNASALIVYDPILRDIEGRPISLSEDGTEILGEADPAYFYVFLGQISSSIGSSGQSTSREWIVNFRFGQLNTSEQLNDVNALLFKLFTPHFDDPLDPSKLTWIEAKSHIGVNGGVTMFVANDDIDLPVIYDGLPIDGQTLVWEETSDGKILKINPNIDLGVASSWSELEGKPSWITDTKPIYYYSEIKNTPDLSVFVTGSSLNKTLADYATLTYLTGELKKYVTLDGAQDIEGVKNFVNGLKVSGMPITKLQDDVIYIDANVVVRGGVTMFGTNEVDLPTIKDEIGFAGYNGSVGLASFDSTQFVISANGTVSVKGGSTGLDTAQLKDYLDSNKYTTETWVKEQGYASASSLSSLQTKVNNFLEGSDTDTIINKWKELEAFLSGLTESDNLATILSTKWTTDNSLINKWNTAYGWGNHASVGYALKSYVDGELAKYVTLGTKQTITGEKNFTGGLKVNGSPIYYDATNKYWKLEGDLLVTGGVTMYGTDEGDIPSILDSLPIASTTSLGVAMFDSTYFKVASSGKVTLLPDNVGLNESSLNSYLTTNKYLTQTKADDRYLSIEGGTLNGTVKVPQLTVYMDTDSSRVRGLAWANTSGSRISSLHYWNTEKKFILNPVGSSDAYVDAVGKYNLVIGENTLTYNTYDVLHSNNYADNITKRNVVINGSKWTVFSSVETDTTGVYAPTSIGTANQVLVSSGSGAPTWANQSTLSVGNATSATKLQTARTIWGQSFDGTANINGAFYMPNNTYMYFKNSDGTDMLGMYVSTGNTFVIGNGIAEKGGGTYISGNNVRLRYGTSKTLGFILTSSGNVGINVESPSSYRLEVGGVIRSTGGMVVSNNKPYWCKNTSGNDLSMVQVDSSNNCLFGYGARGSYTTYLYGNTIRLQYGNNAGTAIYVASDGKVGIGTTSPAYKLDVNGTGYFSNGINYSTATAVFNSVGIKFATDVARISVSSAGNMGIYATGSVSISGNSKSENSGTGLTIDESGNTSLTGKLLLSGTDATTALLEFSRDGYNYITFPNTLSIGTSTAAADRQLIINSTNATFQCNIIPNASATYYIGNWGNYFNMANINVLYCGASSNNLWLVGGKSSDNVGVVIARNTTNATSGAEICRFNTNGMVWASGVYGDIRTTDTNIYLRRAGDNANTLIFGSGYFSPYSTATDLLTLGRPLARWKGVYLGATTTTTLNTNGVVFCDTSNYGQGVVAATSNGRIGIGACAEIYFRVGCTKGADGTITNSSTGAVLDKSSNLLVSGGITMYSDIRKKTKLQEVELSLSQIANAPLIQHYYNSDQEKTTHVGSIAQYWAGLNNWFCKLDNEGFYTMEIQNAALASAISVARHLERYESKTDKQIRKLKKRIQELEDKLERLEGGNYGC